MKIVFKRVKSKKQLFFLLFVILLNLILWSKLYVLKTQFRQTHDILKLQQNQQVNWQTYTDKKYGFAFQYPSSWIMSDDICPSEPFCLIVIDYNQIPTQEQLNKQYPEGGIYSEIDKQPPEDVYAETSDIRVFTKGQFAKFKTDLENGTMPQTVLGGWDFVKVASKIGIQKIFYDIFSGRYIIETIVSYDNIILQIATTLPIENIIEKNVANIEKSQQKLEYLKQKKFDAATQKVINQYNRLLSAFIFTKSDFVFYQDAKNNLSFYYPLRYGTIVKRSFGPTADFHFSDLHFPGNPNSDLDEYSNSLTVFPEQAYEENYNKKRYQLLDQLFGREAMELYPQGKIIKWDEPSIPNEPQEERLKRLQRESKKTYIQSEVVGTAIKGMYYFIRSGNGVSADVNLIFELLTERGVVIKIELSLWSKEQSAFEQQLNTIFKTQFGRGLSYDQVTLDKWENDVNDFVQNKTPFVFKKELEEMKILVESLQML